MSSLTAILGVARTSGITIDVHASFYEDNSIPDTYLLGNEKLVGKTMVAAGQLTFGTVSSLRGISIMAVSDVDALYASDESLAQADSLEAARVTLIDDVKQEHRQKTTDLTN